MKQRVFAFPSRQPTVEALEDRTVLAVLPSGFSESVVAVGLSAPTAMEFAPDGRLFVAQQGGSLRVIQNGRLLPTPFLSLSVDSSGERGLLGVAFDPNFASNQYVYVYYTSPAAPVHNRVSRFTASGNTAVPGSEHVVLDLDNLNATNHNGGALHFGADGKLYVGVGENANSANAQSLNNYLGKVLRINADGSFPTDNPFYTTTTAERSAIWTLGLRNPYTFAVQPGTGRVFINDVGSGGSVAREEINDGIAGSNYGWPTVEGVAGDPRFRDPLYAYAHTGGVCAITGGTFYNPATSQFPADYAGDYFFADLCAGWVKRFDPATSAVTDFASGLNQPVDLKVSADGSLYYLTRGGGVLYRAQYNAGPSYTSSFFADWNGDGKPDLVSVRGANTVSGMTEVDILDAATNYQTFLLHTATGLQTVNAAYAFGVADWNRDGRPDLFVIIKSGTGTNTTEVHIADGASNFQSFLLHTGTALAETDATVDFQVIDTDHDNTPDLVAFKKSNTGSHATEIHVLSGATNFQTFSLHTRTGLGETGAEAALSLVDLNNDGFLDLAYVKKFNTGSGKTEVHVLDGRSGFQTFLLHTATALAPTGSEADFRFVTLNGSLALAYVKKNATGSGWTELHLLSAALNFSAFLSQVATPLPTSS